MKLNFICKRRINSALTKEITKLHQWQFNKLCRLSKLSIVHSTRVLHLLTKEGPSANWIWIKSRTVRANYSIHSDLQEWLVSNSSRTKTQSSQISESHAKSQMRMATGTTLNLKYQQRTHPRSPSTKKPMRMNLAASKHKDSKKLQWNRVACDSAATSRNKNCASIESPQMNSRNRPNFEWASMLITSEWQNLMTESEMTSRAPLFASPTELRPNHSKSQNLSRHSQNTTDATRITLAGLSRIWFVLKSSANRRRKMIPNRRGKKRTKLTLHPALTLAIRTTSSKSVHLHCSLIQAIAQLVSLQAIDSFRAVLRKLTLKACRNSGTKKIF